MISIKHAASLAIVSAILFPSLTWANQSLNISDRMITKTMCPEVTLATNKIDPMKLCYLIRPVATQGSFDVYYANTDALDPTSTAFLEGLFAEELTRGSFIVGKNSFNVVAETTPLTSTASSTTQSNYKFFSIGAVKTGGPAVVAPSPVTTPVPAVIPAFVPVAPFVVAPAVMPVAPVVVTPIVSTIRVEDQVRVTPAEYAQLKRSRMSVIAKKLGLTQAEIKAIAASIGITKYPGNLRQNNQVKKALLQRFVTE